MRVPAGVPSAREGQLGSPTRADLDPDLRAPQLREGLGQGPLLFNQADEVPILGHHDCTRRSGSLKDDGIAGIPQPKIPDRNRLNAPSLGVNPAGEERRELGIQPQRQPTRTG